MCSAWLLGMIACGSWFFGSSTRPSWTTCGARSGDMSVHCTVAKQALTNAGFLEVKSPLFGEALGSEYRRVLAPPWSITAWLDTGDALDHVDIHLQLGEQSVGNIHRVTTDAAVADLPAIVATLSALAGTDTLKCPKRKVRWIATKLPKPRDGWQPFLSCTGMRVGRSREGKRIACDGTSTALQPIVTH